MRTNMKHLIIVSLLFSMTLLATGSAYAAPLYFPHVVTTTPWQTEIAVINTSPDQTVSGTLNAFSNDGQPVETKNVALPGHGRRQIDVADEFANHTDIGYIIFETDSDTVQGYAKFYREGVYRTAIPAVKEVNTSNIYIPHIASNAQWWTELSLLNTTSETKQICIAFQSTFKAGPQITLNANEHKDVRYCEPVQHQPQTNIQSAMIINADGIIGLELFGSTDGRPDGRNPPLPTRPPRPCISLMWPMTAGGPALRPTTHRRSTARSPSRLTLHS